MLHVLVVDNDDESRNVLRLALEIMKYSVTTARNGHEAAKLFMSEPGIMFVVSDLNMGASGQDGNDLFFAIELELKRRGARFALMTGSNQQEILDELASHGAVILKKPMQLESLEAFIAA